VESENDEEEDEEEEIEITDDQKQRPDTTLNDPFRTSHPSNKD